MSLDYLTDVIILLAAAVIMVPLSRLARLGIVPGFLLAGVVVGPSSLGLINNQAETDEAVTQYRKKYYAGGKGK